MPQTHPLPRATVQAPIPAHTGVWAGMGGIWATLAMRRVNPRLGHGRRACTGRRRVPGLHPGDDAGGPTRRRGCSRVPPSSWTGCRCTNGSPLPSSPRDLGDALAGQLAGERVGDAYPSRRGSAAAAPSSTSRTSRRCAGEPGLWPAAELVVGRVRRGFTGSATGRPVSLAPTGPSRTLLAVAVWALCTCPYTGTGRVWAPHTRPYLTRTHPITG